MDVITCLVGPSGTGKTTVAYELQKRYGYNMIESYTTRPPRYPGEKGHIFVDPIELEITPHMVDDAIASTYYNGHYYWATRGQYLNQGVSLYVIDPDGVKELRESVDDTIVLTVAMWTDESVRAYRMESDGRENRQIKERLHHDRETFSFVPCDYLVDANNPVEKVVDNVNKIILTVNYSRINPGASLSE